MVNSRESSPSTEQVYTRRDMLRFVKKPATVGVAVKAGLYTTGGTVVADRTFETYNRMVDPFVWAFHPSELDSFPIMNRVANIDDLKSGFFVPWGDSMIDLKDNPFGGITGRIVKKINDAQNNEMWRVIPGYAEKGKTTTKVISGLYDPEHAEKVYKNLSGKTNINICLSAAGNNFLELLTNQKIHGLVTRAIDTMPRRKSDLRRKETWQWYMATLKTLTEFQEGIGEIKSDVKKILHGFFHLKDMGIDIQRIFLHSLLNERYAPAILVKQNGITVDEMQIAGDANREHAAELVSAHINAAVAQAASEIHNTHGIEIVGMNFFNGIPRPELWDIHPSPNTQNEMANFLLKQCTSPEKNSNLFDYLTRKIKAQSN